MCCVGSNIRHVCGVKYARKPDPAPLKETLYFTVMTDFKKFATVAPNVTSFLPKMEEPSNPDDWGRECERRRPA